jgi:hypothetical protein
MIKGETVFSGAPHPGTELKVLQSAAGYYLGFLTEEGEPYSRETDYFKRKEYAEFALDLVKIAQEKEQDLTLFWFMRNTDFNPEGLHANF